MVKFINNSRIDGYPILMVSNDEEGQKFIDYVKDNFSLDTISLVQKLGDHDSSFYTMQYLNLPDLPPVEYMYVKISLNDKEYTTMFETYKNIEQRKDRKEKIEKLNLDE